MQYIEGKIILSSSLRQITTNYAQIGAPSKVHRKPISGWKVKSFIQHFIIIHPKSISGFQQCTFLLLFISDPSADLLAVPLDDFLSKFIANPSSSLQMN